MFQMLCRITCSLPLPPSQGSHGRGPTPLRGTGESESECRADKLHNWEKEKVIFDVKCAKK